MSRHKISPTTRLAVIERDGPYCRHCGRFCDGFGWKRNERGAEVIYHPNFQYDHIVPFSVGGSNKPDNIVFACEHCNRSRSNRKCGPLRPPQPFQMLPPSVTGLRQDMTRRTFSLGDW